MDEYTTEKPNITIHPGAIYLMDIFPGMTCIVRVMEYAPHWDYAICRWGEVQDANNPAAVVAFDTEGVISVTTFEKAQLIADPSMTHRVVRFGE